jgi:Xaa-Pro aminopeptidase
MGFTNVQPILRYPSFKSSEYREARGVKYNFVETEKIMAINSGERGFNLPKFSLAERERRWARVRQLMTNSGFEALIGFPNQSHWDQFQADNRYLTHIGGHQTEVAIVFPASGEVTAFVRGGNEVEWWGIAQDWVRDIRPSRRSWGGPVIERLKELKLERGRIGVCGLKGLLRAPEGTVCWGIFERVKSALPNASFESATELLQDARSVKSAEEIVCIERAAEILDAVVSAVMNKARPGVMENEVVATIWHTIIAHGGDYPSMTHWGAGKGVPWACRIAPHRPLEAGDIFNMELEAKYGGYIAQTVQAGCLGERPKNLVRAFEVSCRIFDSLLKIMKPGTTYRSVLTEYQKMVRDAGLIPRGMLLHGRGLGEDRPQITGEMDQEAYGRPQYTMHLDCQVEEGNVLVLKPAAMSEDAPDTIRCGDTVAVEKAGARRLGKRCFEFPAL